MNEILLKAKPQLRAQLRDHRSIFQRLNSYLERKKNVVFIYSFILYAKIINHISSDDVKLFIFRKKFLYNAVLKC